VDESAARLQLGRLSEVRSSRNQTQVRETLADLKKAATDGLNIMPFLISSVKAYATLGEIMDTLKDVYGEYREPITY
jgi:methylmalonyl-CoA mutase N-terminal domain/subunit